MKSQYSIKDLDECAVKAQDILTSMGCDTTVRRTVSNGKYSYVFEANNGRKYITGMDSKDICMQKLERVCNNPMFFIQSVFGG